VVELHPLGDEDIRDILEAALKDHERGLPVGVELDAEARERIVVTSGGDARVALTTLELAFLAVPPDADGRVHVGLDVVADTTRTRTLAYDKDADTHYDVISAFIKSMRGSDPDAAVYWLARMVHGGEDPKFIARRMLIFASEDVGNADPTALLVAHAAVKSAEFIGWPECRINLSQAAIYLALAPKSNAAISAIDAALKEVRTGPARQVPDHLRDRHRPGAEDYPAYRYPHSYPEGWVDQQYLPDGLEEGSFYRAGSRGWEAEREKTRPRRRKGSSAEE
jgi:putative ATPase